MTTSVCWATVAGAGVAPMGLQHYEGQLLAALLRIDSPDWAFTNRTIGGLRQRPRPVVRLPTGLLALGGIRTAELAGRWAYRGVRFVHRFDLRLPPPSGAEVVTVHDLPPLRFDDEGEIPSWVRQGAQRARLVICPSEFAASEVRELLGVDRVAVVPNGVGPPYPGATPMSAGELHGLGIHGPFLLHVGGSTRRKNLPGLAGAWRQIGPQLPGIALVSVGPNTSQRAAAFEGLPDVVLTGYQTQERVARLMASAGLVVVPSTYEGFGLPCLEAMAVGTPVVAARAGALAEVCGDAAQLCDSSAEGLAEAVSQVVHDEALRDSLVARGVKRAGEFTWERSAAAHLEVYATAFL